MFSRIFAKNSTRVMQQPEQYYHGKLEEVTALLKNHKQKRNGITLVKIILFLSAVFFIYTFANTSAVVYLCAFFVAIALFIVINIFETKLLKKIAFLSELKKCSEVELEYLAGNLQHLPAGNEYKDQTHPYAHDLDLFGDSSLFQAVNRTVTPHGREKMRQWLLNPLKSEKEITARQQAASELSGNPDWCHAFRATGNSQRVSPLAIQQIEKWQQERESLPRWITPFLYILPVITFSAWILNIFSVIAWNLPFTLSCLSLILCYVPASRTLRAHLRLDEFTRSFSNLHELIHHFADFPCHSSQLLSVREQLFSTSSNADTALRSLRKIQEGFDQRTNVLVAILLNGLLLRELHLLKRLVAWKREYAEAIPAWVNATGELDALVSLANYKYNHPDFVTPALNTDVILRGAAIGHPLLSAEGCVTNDFGIDRLHEFYIITGANMAGKSTFLRAVGVNLVLACCGAVVRASSFEFQPMAIFTSMRTVDDLAKGTSYFHAELLRLQKLVTMAEREEKTFIILDEILKGTNSRDKLNGSRRFLQKLLTLPIAGLVATHDLELGALADTQPEHYFNRCFEITHTDDDIVYDYKLKPGISQNMNASILLEKMKLV